jgi:hypothetical protein
MTVTGVDEHRFQPLEEQPVHDPEMAGAVGVCAN